MPLKILLLAGSVRSGSFNVSLRDAANKAFAEAGAETTIVSLADYPLPIVDEDLKNDKGIPANSVKLARQFAAHDAVFIASPEYNSSIPPLLKNTIDWLSLTRDEKPFDGLTVAIGGATNGILGTTRMLPHLRSVLMNVGCQIITEQVTINRAASAFGDDGMPIDERQQAMLKSCVRALLERATPGRGRS
jgi:NAD(P)H-dependent FMN reductase